MKRPHRHLWPLPALLFALFYLAPDLYSLHQGFYPKHSLPWAAAVSAPLLLFFALTGSLFATRLFTWFVLASTFLLRLFRALLLDFSGQGFNSNVFNHIHWQSLRVGLDDYGLYLLPLLLVFTLWCMLVWKWLQRRSAQSHPAWLLFALALWLVGFNLTAEGEFLHSARLFYSNAPDTSCLNTQQREQARRYLIPLRGDRPLPPGKDQLWVHAPAQPINLILLYLESFNDMLLDLPNYPNLTPNLRRLRQKYGNIRTNYSAAYVTIEGLANSACGTLFDMRHANNSLTTEKGRLPQLPCLGDVLNLAGYQQIFMGGAQLDFASKGDFYLAHGYQQVYGWNYWAQHLPDREKTVWGLSDPDLFDQALKTIDRLNEQPQPWNLTLLTLGTHLPGFVYRGCPVYQEAPEEVFLNAIHCTDFLVGRFIEALQKRDILEHTLLVIQGDHGVFPNPEMKRLFQPKGVADHRLLTLFIGPGCERIQPEAYMASTDLAPTILELLNIQHNAEFMLGKSILQAEKSHYRMTRFGDYYQHRFIATHDTDADCDPAKEKPLILPPEPCVRNHTFDLLHKLNQQYGPESTPVARFIQARIQHRQYWYLNIDFHLLSCKARYAGRPVSAIQPGYRLLWLDENFRPGLQLYFPVDEGKQLHQALLKHPPAGTDAYFLLSATGVDWPDILLLPAGSQIILGRLQDGKIQILQCDEDGELLFYPDPQLAPTMEEFQEFQSRSAARFCPISHWGPQKTTVGRPFNPQKDGRSAWWLQTDCAPQNVRWLLDGQPLDTVVRLPVITAGLHEDKLLQAPGQHRLELLDPETGHTQFIGQFIVEPFEGVHAGHQHDIPGR